MRPQPTWGSQQEEKQPLTQTHFNITYTKCGHTATLDLTDTPKDSRNLLARHESRQNCAPCEREWYMTHWPPGQAESFYLDIEFDLPRLYGNPVDQIPGSIYRYEALMIIREHFINHGTMTQEKWVETYILPAQGIRDARWWGDLARDLHDPMKKAAVFEISEERFNLDAPYLPPFKIQNLNRDTDLSKPLHPPLYNSLNSQYSNEAWGQIPPSTL